MKTAVVRARIPEKLKRDFEAAATAHEMSQSQVMRMLMTRYVEREKQLIRRHEETLEALEDIEAGRIVQGKDVMEWLAGWGDETERNPPA